MDLNQLKKTDMFSKRLLYKFLGGRPIAETTGIVLVCFDGKYIWAYKKILKIKKSAYELITSRAACGQRAAGWAALLYIFQWFPDTKYLFDAPPVCSEETWRCGLCSETYKSYLL